MRLNELGYSDANVNHSEVFADPDTGANTERIESAWKEGKLWLKRVRRRNHLMQNRLDELAWRMNNSNHPKNLLGEFLCATATEYTCDLQYQR